MPARLFASFQNYSENKARLSVTTPIIVAITKIVLAPWSFYQVLNYSLWLSISLENRLSAGAREEAQQLQWFAEMLSNILVLTTLPWT